MDTVFKGETVISPENFCEAVLDNWLWNFVGEPTAVMLHRNVFSRFGLFNPYLIQICDFEYWIRVASNGGLVYVPEILTAFRCHGKATSAVNRNSRKFRTHLDELVCYHEMLFHPLYEQLRNRASKCRPPVDMNQWFASGVQQAFKLAHIAARDTSNPDPGPLKELAELSRLFPGFKIIKKIPFSITFGKCWWRLKNRLERQAINI